MAEAAPAAPPWTGRPPAGAQRGPGARACPTTSSRTTGPTTPRPSPPPSCRRRPVLGRGTGRSKKEAEQEAAGPPGARSPDRRRPAGAERCPSCPRSRSSATAWSAGSSAAPSPRSRCATRGPCGGTSRAPTHFVAALTGRTVTGAHRRGKYLWLRLARLRARRGPGRPPRHDRPAARREAARARRDAPARPLHVHRRRPRAAVRRPADLRRPGGRGRRATRLPPRLAHIARDPLDDAFDDEAFVAALRAGTPRSSGRCSTRP